MMRKAASGVVLSWVCLALCLAGGCATRTVVTGDVGDGCPADLPSAIGEPCTVENQQCGTCPADPCVFCNIIRCHDGKWTRIEIFPSPSCGQRDGAVQDADAAQDANVTPPCPPPPPPCNWCNGEYVYDQNGCLVGYRCANGVDPCSYDNCVISPWVCGPGELCDDGGLCWSAPDGGTD